MFDCCPSYLTFTSTVHVTADDFYDLLQSVREDGELQVWTIDKGLLISSVSVGVQVRITMKLGRKNHK